MADAAHPVTHRHLMTPSWNEVDPDLVRLYRRFAISAGSAAALIGTIVLIGWFVDIPILRSLYPPWIETKANTAVGLVAVGGGLAIRATMHRTLMQLTRGCAVLAIALGLATAIEYAFGGDLGIDQLLVVEPGGAIGTTHPGRMSELSAVSFVLCGLALLTLDRDTWSWLADVPAVSVVVISGTALLGYAFGAEELYSLAGYITALSAPAAGAFFLAATGLVATRIERGAVFRLASPNSGGVMLRYLLPAMVVGSSTF